MKVKKTYFVPLFSVLFLMVIILNGGIVKVKADVPQVINLKNQLLPLNTTEAGNGYEDLDKLQVILKDKKVVAMGEATHGTKEFFQMKDRMFEFLVEKMGYRLFAIEGEFGSAQDVNNYILNGIGNANDAVKSMGFWTWSTEEVVNMIEWMRNYNKDQAHISKVKFYGIDMQSADKITPRVMEYITKVDINSLSEFGKTLLDVNNNSRINSFSKDKLTNVKKDTEELLNMFKNNKENYIEKSSISEYEMIYQDLNVINQFVEYTTLIKDADWKKTADTREFYMAQNVKWILDYEKQFGNDKIMLWAHNGHVSKKFPNYKSMGENLKEIFNDKLYVIGFDFYEGSFRANPSDDKGNLLSSEIAKFNVDKSDINTLAGSFEKTGIPLSFMDFKSASEDKDVAAWLSQPQLTHTIGAGYNGYINQWMLPEVPIDSYDGLIFVKKTSAAIGINGYETTINDGDNFIKNYYRNMSIASIAILVSIIIFIILISVYIYKKIKRRRM